MDSVISFVRKIIPPTETNFYVPSTWVYNGAVVDLDFANGVYWNAPSFDVVPTDLLSISRASIGYAKTSSGTLTQFASNVLRITDLGLLVEDSRTNYQIYSQEMSNANWTAFLLTSVTDNAATAPDGTSTACSIIPDTIAGNTHRMSTSTGPISTSAVPYTVSVYMKAGSYGYGFISSSLATAAKGYAIIVNLSTGAITDSNNANGATGVSSSVEALGNGWYRASIVMDGAASDLLYMNFGPMGTATAASWHGGGLGPNWTGDATSNALFWGAQMEPGAFVSSYIPTTTTSATRAEDVVMAGAGNGLGSVLRGSTASIVVSVGDVINNNGVQLYFLRGGGNSYLYANTNTSITLGDDTSGQLFIIPTASPFVDGNYRVGGSWSAGGRSVAAFGETNSNEVALTAANSADVNMFGGGGIVPWCYAKRLTVWNTRLADATLQALTAP